MKYIQHLDDTQLNEYLDRRLPVDAPLAVDAHLEACAECRKRLQEIQLVFASLASLPEVRISRDLTSSVLRRLPRKSFRLWTPFFAAQTGIVLGILVWLASEATEIINPPFTVTPNFSGFAGFHLPTLTLSGLNSFFPPINLQSWTINFMLTVSKIQLGLPSLNAAQITPANLQYWLSQLPEWRLQLAAPHSFLVYGAVLLFWIAGNAILLRGRPEAGK